MDPAPPLAGTVSDLELRTNRIADAGVDLKTKHAIACELREMIDTVRDADSTRALPRLILTLLEVLRSSPPAFNKETLEYQFRKVTIEILHRVPVTEAIRPQAQSMCNGLLHVLQTDNEENGVICCKIMIDLIRGLKYSSDDFVTSFLDILTGLLTTISSIVEEFLSEDSSVLDSNALLPSQRSFKVLAEMGMVVVSLSQVNRTGILSSLPKTIPLSIAVLSFQSSAQKKAREDHEAMGQTWSGMAPTVRNVTVYTDLLNAQIKTISFLAYLLKGMPEQFATWGEVLILSSLRILQDCPATAVQQRKDLTIVFRHLINTPNRSALVPHIDKLATEAVLLGNAVGSQETLRANSYAAVADLIHHLRNDITIAQVVRMANIFSNLLLNPNLAGPMHVSCAKMVFNLIDVIATKDTPQNAARVIKAIFDTSLDKLDAMVIIQDELSNRWERLKRGEKDIIDVTTIEKSRPVASAHYAITKPEETIHDHRHLFRTMLHGFRAAIIALKKIEAPTPDGPRVARLFEGCIRCMSLFDGELQQCTEAMEWFAGVLCELNLHVFQEVWTQKMDFFFSLAQKRPQLLHICSTLFTKEPVSPTLVAIVLKYLVDDLPSLGDTDNVPAAAKIRLYKFAFNAVGAYPALNEPILATHLSKLIMDCFPLASKAATPTNYFHLLRALFRAIGGGGGRFELLYKEVLPLLPEMLENLNRQLLASEGATREMIVELCLTVPLRLTHLLPHLTYLMQPLTLALRGGPELVNQGLRTLELCIDNLTPDFLDPTLSTVLEDLMDALHSHLKPQPASHLHAHIIIRILGKLGGRNRRLLNKEPSLEFRFDSEPAAASVYFNGSPASVELRSMVALALKVLERQTPNHQGQAYGFLESVLSILISQGVKSRDQQEVFQQCLQGVYCAVFIPDLAEQAESFALKFARAVLHAEVTREHAPGFRPQLSLMYTAFLDALPNLLGREKPKEVEKAEQMLTDIVKILTGMSNEPGVQLEDIYFSLNQLGSSISALCTLDTWTQKNGGCLGIKVFLTLPGLPLRWVNEKHIDIVRNLFHILKDVPFDLPKDVSEVEIVIERVLRATYREPLPESYAVTSPPDKLQKLLFILVNDLGSSNATVRQVVRTSLDLLVELTGKSHVILIAPHRERLLQQFYAKPLRALPFHIQIGIIEAIRYCMGLNPPIPDPTDELLRLLHEALALADADDLNVVGLRNPRQSQMDMIKLKVACIRLLTASMTVTDSFANQPQTRSRVTQAYFKALYSPLLEIKDVAHEGLRAVLAHQNRLPRELLQTGLRPILMNLADAKRLQVPGLEGLARLLELLTNYFKVEIGHKLIDHFRIVAEPAMLEASARLPLHDNEGITKLVRLVNVFHLLPSQANIFLENLTTEIVKTEDFLRFSTQNPFTEPLSKYLDRYPIDALDFFMQKMRLQPFVRTLRTVLQAKLAPSILYETCARTPDIVNNLIKSGEHTLIQSGLDLLSDIVRLIPWWSSQNEWAISQLVALWQSEHIVNGWDSLDIMHHQSTLMSIFMEILRSSPRVDLLLEIVSIYARDVTMDLVDLTHFLYNRVALSDDIMFKRNVLLRFGIWFKDTSYSWAHKGHFIRVIVTPLLLVHASRDGKNAPGLLDAGIIHHIHQMIWQPMSEGTAFADIDDAFIVELLHFTTIMVQHYPGYLEDVQKVIIKAAWHFITSEDMVIQQSAYLLAARFFEAFDAPQKFILRAWTGLLRPPHHESRGLVRQALDILAPVWPRVAAGEAGFPLWAKTTRRLLAEEGHGFSQIIIIYGLIVRQKDLFYPVRALFVPHMVNSLTRLGLTSAASGEFKVLSLDILQTIFDWERKATSERQVSLSASQGEDPSTSAHNWVTPLVLRETMISYLLKLISNDSSGKTMFITRAVNLLQLLAGRDGWSEVTIHLHYFSKALEQDDFGGENMSKTLNTAKALQVIASEKDDAWFVTNADILQQLVRKGMVSDHHELHDALHPVFDRLVTLSPLPEKEEEPANNSFHSFIFRSITDALQNTTTLRGVLLMLKSVVQVTPERIDAFSMPLTKLLSKLAKEHLQSTKTDPEKDITPNLVLSILHICKISVAYLGEQRRWLLGTLVVLIERSRHQQIADFILSLAREWALKKRESYPTMKEKSNLLQRMAVFEDRGEKLCNEYLELIYDIYTEPSLRRSDLTTRLEQPFLLGCRARNPVLREKFIDLLDASIPRTLTSRMVYVLGVQSWEALADHYWINLALHLVMSAVDSDAPLTSERKGMKISPSNSFLRRKAHNLVNPLQRLAFLDSETSHAIWVSVFPAAWACLSRREQIDVTQHMIALLSKEYHIKQANMRPNVVQTLLAGVLACNPPMILPPHLVKYLAKTYGAWHVSMEILETTLIYVRDDEQVVRDVVNDSLAEVYAELCEDDMFYGIWRRRSLQQETNRALAFEQNGMWDQAINAYEAAQTAARNGQIQYNEAEYCLWEDHWMLAAEKLQQWDILHDLARTEANNDLLLESAWRIKDWTGSYKDTLEEQMKAMQDAPTPRRLVFQAFMALIKSPGAVDKNTEFTKVLDEAMQLSLKKWVNLPSHLSAAHVPLLQHFQQFVELQEAVQIFGSLSTTNAQNLEKKSSDLKMVLQAWRERLPNAHDDISVWSDLVAWRQNVFNGINNAYIPLIQNSTAASTTNNNTYGFRGYHETAWIMNRFARVARKHELLDVCFNQLNKIYTLPNIEISEAFFKLREQALCHYQKREDLQAGLEVINNTNLVFFTNAQRAEFHTLKGMFHAKFGRIDDANLALGQAVQLDMNQAKSWAEWGRFNDHLFQEKGDLNLAAAALSCYLQAAGQYKNGKSRPLLTRVLWLLSIDDMNLTVARAFDTYKGEAAFWYWITLIPQLCLSISQREVKQARYILLNLAKIYPQASFFHLRTTRQDMEAVKKNLMNEAIARERMAAAAAAQNGDSMDVDHTGANPQPQAALNPTDVRNHQVRQAAEFVDEIVTILKTAFPLLILSLETMVDHINARFKATTDEEIYRLVCMLLQDATQVYAQLTERPDDDGYMKPQTLVNLQRMHRNLLPGSEASNEYKEDFLTDKLTQYEYIQRLQRWRDRYERQLDARPRTQPLDLLCPWLTDFQYTKFDEIEVPGQYTEDKDNNQNFVRIFKFVPYFENCRSHGYSWRRLSIRGHDNSKTSFSVQLPSGRHCRREERVMQVLRTFNGALAHRKETRKRNLSFHMPAAVSCSPSLRLLQNDSSYITFGDIYDQHCARAQITREDPILMSGEKIRKVIREMRQTTPGREITKLELISLKKEVMNEVVVKLVPEDVISKFMLRSMDGPQELWRMRKQFAQQLAALNFTTYVFCLSSRVPSRFHISRSTGQMYMTELLPSLSNSQPVLNANDPVPFRLTPNMQHFMGPITTEGILSTSMLAIGRCLTEPEYELEQQLCLFARDEIMTWTHSRKEPWTFDAVFRTNCAQCTSGIAKRASHIACRYEREQNPNSKPIVQTVTNLISMATNPVNLMKASDIFYPWF